jgi:hypothetical protein
VLTHSLPALAGKGSVLSPAYLSIAPACVAALHKLLAAAWPAQSPQNQLQICQRSLVLLMLQSTLPSQLVQMLTVQMLLARQQRLQSKQLQRSRTL